MSALRRALRSQVGYTMAEMLVATATIGLVMAGVLTIMMTGQQSFTVGSNRSEAQQSGRLVVHRLAEEVRTGGWDPKNTASFAAITALAPPDVGFRIANDWNATGAIETNLTVNINGALRGEQTTYDFVSNTLRRQESQLDTSPVPVTSAVEAITLQYLDADDVDVTANAHLAATALTIRTVVVTVTTRPDTQSSATANKVSMTSTIRARVRNR
jgi:Tfp pilus assembly protein PilW